MAGRASGRDLGITFSPNYQGGTLFRQARALRKTCENCIGSFIKIGPGNIYLFVASQNLFLSVDSRQYSFQFSNSWHRSHGNSQHILPGHWHYTAYETCATPWKRDSRRKEFRVPTVVFENVTDESQIIYCSI